MQPDYYMPGFVMHPAIHRAAIVTEWLTAHRSECRQAGCSTGATAFGSWHLCACGLAAGSISGKLTTCCLFQGACYAGFENSMALFARRYLQRILDENSGFLTPGQLLTAVRLLNSVYDEYLGKEWEMVVLNAASKCWHV